MIKGCISLLICVLSFGMLTQAQVTPGNIGTANLTAWFKADALANGATPSWTTTYPTGAAAVTVTDQGAPFPTATNTPVNAISNYNTTIEFVNPNDNANVNLQAFENYSTNLNLLSNATATSEGSFFSSYYLPATSTNDHVLLYNENANNTGIQFRNLGGTGRFAIGFNLFTSTNASRDWTEDYLPNIVSYRGNRSSFGTLNAFKRSREFTNTTASQSGGGQGLYVGVRGTGGGTYTANSAYNGFISELIFFDRDLTDLEMNKVHTYLGIKFANTLDNTGGGTQGDYIATDGTIVWDASTHPAYHNGVIGIARDDDEGLVQKQSHNFTDNYRIYLNTLEATNVANTGVFNANFSYVVMGSNTGDYCASLAANAEVPPGVQSRLENEFKIVKTNFGQPFNLDIDLEPCTSLAGIDLNNLSLLVDDDGDFTNAQVFNQTNGLTFSLNGNFLTIEGISDAHIPNNDFRFITIAYNTPLVTIDANQNTMCEGDSVEFTLGVIGSAVPLDVDYTDETNTYTLNGVTDGYTFWVYPNVSTTYTIVGYTNVLDCCGAGNQNTSEIITVNQRPTVTANATNDVLCVGDTTILTGGGADNYVWDNGILDGIEFYPTTSNTYTVIGTDLNGCRDTNNILITVNPVPTITANANVTTICVGDSILLSGAGADTYVWDNGAIDQEYSHPIVTTTYTVIGENQFGCLDTAEIDITVNNNPIVEANASPEGVCMGDPLTLYGTGANSYQWQNGVVDNQSFIPTDPAQYYVEGTDAQGCIGLDTIFVDVYPTRDLYIGEDTTICPQNPITIDPQADFESYSWNFGSSNAVVISIYEGIYILTAYDEFGCDYSDTLEIFYADDCFPNIYAPNAFSPDSDEFNSTFKAVGTYIDYFEMLVWDRWGNLVFESLDINNGWDGNNKEGKICKDGTYVYRITYSYVDNEDGNKTHTGHVTLIR